MCREVGDDGWLPLCVFCVLILLWDMAGINVYVKCKWVGYARIIFLGQSGSSKLNEISLKKKLIINK